MIEMKFATIAICAALFSLGGYCFLPARRFIMPFILAIAISVVTNIWYAGLLITPVIGTLCLGYKNFGIGNFSRAIWLGLQALAIGLGLAITGHFLILLYVPYIIIAAILAGIFNNRVPQIFGDLIFGGWLGIIVLLVR